MNKNMKKIVIVFLMGFWASWSFAQISPFTFGPTVGFNQTSLSTNVADYQQSAKAGLQGGVFARLTLKKLVIQPEAFIGLKTGEFDFTYSPTGATNKFNASQEVRLTTLDVPLMFGYQLLDVPLIKIRALAGPVASVLLNKKVNVSRETSINPAVPTSEIVQLKDDAAYSIQAGLGVDVWKLTLDARYNFGISYIDNANTLRNNLFTINVGFKII